MVTFIATLTPRLTSHSVSEKFDEWRWAAGRSEGDSGLSAWGDGAEAGPGA